MNKDSLGDRIKRYESITNNRLTSRVPVILRIDGKAFHSFTRNMDKPFDKKLIESMVRAGEKTAKNMMGFVLGYHQSDEFTFYINNTQSLESQSWFNNEILKLTSITASMFTAYFNNEMGGTEAIFDCRVFSVPFEDVPNVFIWRQQDWERNSIQMLARHYFSHKQCDRKNKSDMMGMLHSIGVNWCDLEPVFKNGTFVTKSGNRFHRRIDYSNLFDLISL